MVTYYIKPAKNGQVTVSQKAPNGETLNSSETVFTRQSAIKNILSCIKGHNPKDGTIFRVVDLPNQQSFSLTIKDGEKPKAENIKQFTKAQRARYGV